jgi:hypothetical protein
VIFPLVKRRNTPLSIANSLIQRHHIISLSKPFLGFKGFATNVWLAMINKKASMYPNDIFEITRPPHKTNNDYLE